MVGTIPTEIALLKDLERLDLGTFGLCFGFETNYDGCINLTQTVDTTEDEDDMIGTIPTEIGLMTRLTWLTTCKFKIVNQARLPY